MNCFIEAAAINAERFQDVVHRHGLLDRWQTFERRFLQESP
ncbi:MAG: TraU family protein [bacterium]|uniref:TraU family protein n=1 Tax=Candidatus Methylomirabilis tolerans TaxID=3123416 RepID=A0AAJ1EJ15_9BACT|nr:TraU family protein [Candidatus Methylomirabilis sp.]